MTRRNHLQLVLATDNPDDYRHPMWSKPDEDLPDIVHGLRAMIATCLTPYDGRPNSEYVVNYLSHVYTGTGREAYYPNLLQLLGMIALVTEQHVDRQATQVKKDILYQLARKLSRAVYDGRREGTTE